jgi:thioredoxin-like negative regulator of GroEL
MSDVTVYHFWSPTCRPCQVIKPAIEDLKEEFSQMNWVSVNTHADSQGYAQKFNVSVVPTVVVVKKDVEVARHSGSSIGIYYTILRKAMNAT